VIRIRDDFSWIVRISSATKNYWPVFRIFVWLLFFGNGFLMISLSNDCSRKSSRQAEALQGQNCLFSGLSLLPQPIVKAGAGKWGNMQKKIKAG
jgi:hypothetical protein